MAYPGQMPGSRVPAGPIRGNGGRWLTLAEDEKTYFRNPAALAFGDGRALLRIGLSNRWFDLDATSWRQYVFRPRTGPALGVVRDRLGHCLIEGAGSYDVSPSPAPHARGSLVGRFVTGLNRNRGGEPSPWEEKRCEGDGSFC